MAVKLIAPALGNAVTLGAAANHHPQHVHQGIPFTVEVNKHFTKVESGDVPASAAVICKPPMTNAGVAALPNLGRSFISCHPATTQITGAKDGVHPVVLWSTEGSTGTEVIKVLSGPIKLPTAVVPPEPDVHLPIVETLPGSVPCSVQKENVSVGSSSTVTDSIPKPQGNLMVSSSSEANLIQQFVSNNTSGPLPAQSGQSVEKFLSRIEGELKPPSEVKVETTQSLVSGELPLKSSTAIIHTNVSSPSVAPPLPSSIALQLASMMQTQTLEQKIVVDEHVDSIPNENPSSVSPHRLVIDSLNHTLSEVLTNPVTGPSDAPAPIKENQVDTVSASPSDPCLTFVKPDQGISDIPISTNMCTGNMGNAMTVSPTKICPKEQLGLCGLSLVSALTSNPIVPVVTSGSISQTMEQSCMMTIPDSSIPLSVPMEPNCTMTSDALAAALRDGSLGAPSQDPIPQPMPQLNLEHNPPLPIVTSAAIMHKVMTAQQAQSSQKDSVPELSHGCASLPVSGSMPLSVAEAVTTVSLVPRLEHNMTVQADNLHINPNLVSSSCPSVSSHSNESIGIQCQNLSIDSHVEALTTSQIDVCQNMIQNVEKVSCSTDTIPMPSVNAAAFPVLRMPVHPLARKDIEDQHRAQSRVAAAMERVLKEEISTARILNSEENVTPQAPLQPQLQLAVTVGPKKCGEDGGMVPQELTQMSDHDLLSYINPSCFDQV